MEMVTDSSRSLLRALHKTGQHRVYMQIGTSPQLSQLVDSADEAKTVHTANNKLSSLGDHRTFSDSPNLDGAHLGGNP